MVVLRTSGFPEKISKNFKIPLDKHGCLCYNIKR